MRRLILCLAIGALGTVAACAPHAPEHDKAYYAAHAAERTLKVAACQEDPVGLGQSNNCQSAMAADADARTAHFYDAPKPASRVQTPGQL
jgi:hypothetical protein